MRRLYADLKTVMHLTDRTRPNATCIMATFAPPKVPNGCDGASLGGGFADLRDRACDLRRLAREAMEVRLPSLPGAWRSSIPITGGSTRSSTAHRSWFAPALAA